MAYSDPQATSNPTTGQPILAAWGDIVRDDLEYVARNAPICQALVIGQSITTGTQTAVSFTSSERKDVGGCHSMASQQSRFTAPAGEAGFYEWTALLSWQANATGQREALFFVNGVDQGVGVREPACSSGTTLQSVAWGLQMAAGDYVELKVTQNSGSTLTVTCDFIFEWVRL